MRLTHRLSPRGGALLKEPYDLRKFGSDETVFAMAEPLCILVCVSPEPERIERF
jgi:hypothetical protein